MNEKISFILVLAILLGCSNNLTSWPATSVDADQAKKSIDLLVSGTYSLLARALVPVVKKVRFIQPICK